jgi:hypothetical protein
MHSFPDIRPDRQNVDIQIVETKMYIYVHYLLTYPNLIYVGYQLAPAGST